MGATIPSGCARGLPARGLEHLASRIEIEQENADAHDQIGPGGSPEESDRAGPDDRDIGQGIVACGQICLTRLSDDSTFITRVDDILVSALSRPIPKEIGHALPH